MVTTVRLILQLQQYLFGYITGKLIILVIEILKGLILEALRNCWPPPSALFPQDFLQNFLNLKIFSRIVSKLKS